MKDRLGRKYGVSVDNLDPVAEYMFSDSDPTGEYYGFVDKSENWYIMKLISTVPMSARFANGKGNYAANFAVCGDLTYYYFFELTW